MVTVTDEETMAAKGELAARGFYVEPTSAVCWAALSRARSTEMDSALFALRGNGVVIPLYGAGLKCAA